MYVLDTNVVSELRRERPHGAVLKWLESVSLSELHVSAVTIGELQQGAEMTRSQNPERAAELEDWLDDEVLNHFNVLSFDIASAREWARIMRRQSDTLMLDGMIAATAQVRGYMVVTRNVRDFQQLGSRVLDPFEFEGYL
ncbi:MAG: type II toxin-antitoxin system VapC family toxin [Chloroflexi bacterium]|nr:type II toxin-antitoxin system VapC family toxin [Chloroflexota bacterium]